METHQLQVTRAWLAPDSVLSASARLDGGWAELTLTSDGSQMRAGPLQLRLSAASIRLRVAGRLQLRHAVDGPRLRLQDLAFQLQLPQAPRVRADGTREADQELAAALDELLAARFGRLAWVANRRLSCVLTHWARRYINQQLAALPPHDAMDLIRAALKGQPGGVCSGAQSLPAQVRRLAEQDYRAPTAYDF
ncbi:hypothetical protein FJT64_018109 [Amphibalanus amphitrite]|uniref:Uncharacterized protein n=1 Tax=Amphibalanus amphitrite TaxID=1232801 RepID=A0A6A4X9D6_AMPAM|nr:hypothetical protein FJT64_018109 [Amphibalanus amphitrite]